MLSIIWSEMDNMLHDKKIFLCVVVFAFYCGTNITIAKSSGMSLWEYIILLFVNHYYVIYFMFFLFLWMVISSFRRENTLILIRFFSIKRFYICELIIILLKATLYVTLHVFIAFFIGISQFPYENKYQINKIGGYYNESVQELFEFKKCGLSPVCIILIIILFLILGFAFCALLLRLANILIGKKFTIVISGIMVLNIMLGFKTNLGYLYKFLFLNNYFIFTVSICEKESLSILINILIFMVSIVLGYYLLRRKSGNRKDNSKIFYYNLIKCYEKQVLLFLTLYIGLNVVYLLKSQKRPSILDYIIKLNLGTSIEHFHFKEYLNYILPILFFLFIVAAFLDREKRYVNNQILIRFRTYRNLNYALDSSIIKFLFQYYAVYLIIKTVFGTLVGLLFGVKSAHTNLFLKEYNINYWNLVSMCGISTFFKMVEILIICGILVLLYRMTKKITVSFVLTFFGYGIVFCPFYLEGYVPWGSSMLDSLLLRCNSFGFNRTIFYTLCMYVFWFLLLKLLNKIFVRRISYECN